MVDNQSLQLMRQQGPDIGSDNPVLLSIVVCAYCHEQYIEELLSSVVCRSFERIELIVIDDGSGDGTLQKACGFHYDEHLSVRIFTKPNRGLVDSLNSALKLVHGRFVAFIASDDMYAPGGIDRIIDLIALDLEWMDAALFQAEYVGGNKSEFVYSKAMLDLFGLDAVGRFKVICSEFPKPMLLQSAVFRTDVLREINPWDNDLLLDDWPAFISLFSAACSSDLVIRYFPEILFCRYRVHSGGCHNNLDRQLRATLEVAERVVPPFYRKRSKANVYFDIGLIHLLDRRYVIGLSLFTRAFWMMPSMFFGLGKIKRGLRFICRRAFK